MSTRIYEGKGANQMQSGKLVLDIREAADALSISPWTVRRYITIGKLKAVRIGRRVLIEPAELQRLVEIGRKPQVRANTQEGGCDDAHLL